MLHLMRSKPLVHMKFSFANRHTDTQRKRERESVKSAAGKEAGREGKREGDLLILLLLLHTLLKISNERPRR